MSKNPLANCENIVKILASEVHNTSTDLEFRKKVNNLLGLLVWILLKKVFDRF